MSDLVPVRGRGGGLEWVNPEHRDWERHEGIQAALHKAEEVVKLLSGDDPERRLQDAQTLTTEALRAILNIPHGELPAEVRDDARELLRELRQAIDRALRGLQG